MLKYRIPQIVTLTPKKSIRVTELATELASTFFGWYLSKHKKTR